MATIDLGKIKIVWKGTYSGGTAYVVDEAVVHNGSSYICVANTTGNAPPNATYWNVLAQAGTDGTDVGTTLTTQGDILYRDGSGLQRLAAGTNGQLLKTGGAGANVSWTDAPSGVVKKIHHFTQSSRTTHNSNANTNAFTWTSSFTPLDPVNNLMLVSGIVPANGAGQNYSGFGPRFSKSGGSDYDFNGYGSIYGFNSAHMTHQSYIFIIPANTLAAGTYTVFHRHYSTNSQVDAYFPNSSDDARLTQTRGDLIIQEYKNS